VCVRLPTPESSCGRPALPLPLRLWAPCATMTPATDAHTRRLRALQRQLVGAAPPTAFCCPTAGGGGTRYLHSMIRVTELEKTLEFFAVLGLTVKSESPSESGRFTNIFLSTGVDTDATIELTYNWSAQ
jgi:hypothetical protein